MSVLGISMYTATKIASVTEVVDGAIVNQETTYPQAQRPSIGEMLATGIPVFIISNVPTLIFLAIYFSCREQRKKNLELEKMNIQDSE